MNALATNEKLVQGILPLLRWSWSVSLGSRDRFLAASSVSSSTITIVSWVTVATGHSRATGNMFVKPGLAHSRECDGQRKRKETIPKVGKAGCPGGSKEDLLGSEGPGA